MTDYFAEHAFLPSGVASDVALSVTDGRFTQVEAGVVAGPTAVRLPGVVLPGFANAHSHAFHRALRARTHDRGGTFWTWREQMYAVAAGLTPDSYFELAREVFIEMALSGITCVGEFHYVHHQPDGTPYDDPNAMGRAVVAAAREVGIRITLLDTCYLAGGLAADGPLPLAPEQARFSDGDADGWATRVAQLSDSEGVRIGAAIHSIRAVPRAQLSTVVAASAGRPLHLHLSEQPAENEQCLAFYGVTPTRLLAEAGALGPLTSAVHATHLTDGDIALLGSTQTTSCFCPTTERDLADGIGPARALHDAGSPLCLGSDQHAVIDLVEEARALEMHERLASRQRGRFTIDQLTDAATVNGHRSLGWNDAGRLQVGARADLVAIRLDSVRTTGSDPSQILFSATAADIDTVIVDGQPVVAAHRWGTQR